MADLLNFERAQIVGARMTGISVKIPLNFFALARSTVSKVMAAFEKEGKSSH